MIKLLPFILVALIILGGLGYWRFFVAKQNLQTSPAESLIEEPVEVPKTAPDASLEDRVKSLEDTITPVVNKINASPKPTTNSSLDSRLNTLEGSITELKARVSSLENQTPAPAATSSKSSTVYIPLGSGGGPWANIDWYSMPEYEVSLDPANYPGYSGMVLEVTFRLVEAAGTGSVRLYNVTDSSATSGQLDTNSSTFALKSSSSFKLATGTKTYKLQVKSTSNKDIFIQSARIKVNF